MKATPPKTARPMGRTWTLLPGRTNDEGVAEAADAAAASAAAESVA